MSRPARFIGAELQYRSDIDGLRALAIIPVLGFHYELSPLFKGGYVGVDVFFVISGFLITKIIYDGIADGSYSVVDFYQRRIRRIFPALFAVFAATLLISFSTQFPSETEYVGKSIAYATLFVSNIFFYAIAGYFDPHVANNPLLHTWSLSVEEQFYILFPITVLAIRRVAPTRSIQAIALLAVASFLGSIVAVETNISAAFYLVPFRAWELLTGSLLAIRALPALENKLARNAISAAGLVSVLIAVATYDRGTAFPGLAATLPCFGAAAIIHSGPGTLVGRTLSFLPVRFAGLISYSLYLWHWPLFVYFGSTAGFKQRVILAAIAISIAMMSWWFVERPFRRTEMAPRKILFGGAAAMAIMCLAALIAAPISNVIAPVPKETADLLAFEDYDAMEPMRGGRCFLNSGFDSISYYRRDLCLKLDPARPNILIIGDSHGAHLWHGYQKVLNANVMQATASGCKPVMHLGGQQRCVQLMQEVFEKFLPQHHVDMIVLSARWEMSEVDGAVERASSLSGYADRVVISGPVPEYDLPLPRILAVATAKHRDLQSAAQEHLKPEQKLTDRKFAETIMPRGVSYRSAYSAMCPDTCRLLVGRTPIQFDYGHLTALGSAWLAQSYGRGLNPDPTIVMTHD
ncbi:acyltransferase family protein [Bradyrhizobium sp.]|uniref:acyltransferase family protein n=1 Tax=Bradyrhizobium sp. TaxID=376 RepID=UPI0039E715E7